MSPKAKSLSTTRKMRDRSRSKQWYRIIAPEMFNSAQLGETPTDDPSSLIGRTIEATVQDLTGDFSKMHIKLKFRIHDIRGLDAHTQFIGHSLTSDYVRRMTRRRRSKTDTIIDLTTKDGWNLRLKPMAISERRIQSSQRTALRNIMSSTMKKTASENSIGDFVAMIVSGELSNLMAEATKTIVPLKRVELRKSEVRKAGFVPDISEVTTAEAVSEEEPTAQPVESKEGDSEAETETVTEEETEELTEEELAKEATERKS